MSRWASSNSTYPDAGGSFGNFSRFWAHVNWDLRQCYWTPIFHDRVWSKVHSTWEPFDVNIVNITAEPVNLLTLIIFGYESRVPVCLIHARDNELHRSTDKCSIPRQCDNLILILILLLLQFDISPRSPVSRKRVVTTLLSNQTTFWRPICTNSFPYQTGSPHKATKALMCVHDSTSYVSDDLGRFRRCSTESRSKRRITSQFTQPHTTQSLRQENWKWRK